mgnify:FL=1
MIKNIILEFGFTGITPELDILFKNYEKGLVTSDHFLDTISNQFPQANMNDLINAWNAILQDFPEERLRFLENLAQANQHRLFLLSNTNDLHIECVKEQMGRMRFSRFKNAFEVFYLSYEIGMRKPDTEIFEFVLEKNQLSAQETLFVDDVKENTDAAANLGIHVWNLQVGEEDITQLNRYL